MGRMVKALHPRFGRGPFEKMMEVCMRTCKMTKDSKKKVCSVEEVRNNMGFALAALLCNVLASMCLHVGCCSS